MSRPKGFHHSAETREKQRKSNIGKHKDYRHTKEAVEKIGAASKKLWKQKWYRDTMIVAVNKPNTGQFKDGLIPWNKGLKFNPEFTKKCRFSKTIRRKVKKEFCKWCGVTENLQLDHIIAICNGGTNKIENCQVLCQSCNLIKRDTIDQFIVQIKKKRANSVNAAMPTSS